MNQIQQTIELLSISIDVIQLYLCMLYLSLFPSIVFLSRSYLFLDRLLSKESLRNRKNVKNAELIEISYKIDERKKRRQSLYIQIIHMTIEIRCSGHENNEEWEKKETNLKRALFQTI